MSHCRWSTDDFGCDLYVYQAGQAWMVHVASNRVIPAEPFPPPVDVDGDVDPSGWLEAWTERNRKVLTIVDRSARERIHGPYDGAMFAVDSPGEAADLVDFLAKEGYRVPGCVSAELRAEGNGDGGGAAHTCEHGGSSNT